MPSFFSKLKGKDGPTKASKASKKNALQATTNEPPAKPIWEDAWLRKTVAPEEIQELLKGCTLELKSRGLDMPFMLLPFRPTSDPSAARSFVRNFFDRGQAMYGEHLKQELRLTEPMVLCSVVKWCWSRLPGGVVSWDAYELFRVGEQDSNMARDSFATFIPLSVESDARTKIIFDFFDLLAAIAAHGKTNGLGGRKLSRLAGWWAFEHSDNGKGFEGGYRTWTSAANATSHLFFAYLRSQSPDSVKGINGISTLPMSLQKLVQETKYPPDTPVSMQTNTTKVVMIVSAVSPTPFALLRRANHFQYRDDDRALQQFSDYDDPVQALTDECRRVLRSISSTNQSQISSSKHSTGLIDASWSRFEDFGFSGAFDEAEEDDDDGSAFMKQRKTQGLRTAAASGNAAGGRPTTPSWADFLSSGFVDEAKNGPAPLLLPPDKILPPIETSGRGQSSQSHRNRHESENDLDPGELASITRFDFDEAFWWVWISSLAGEETPERKAVFGRCALVESTITGGKWLVFEEMVKGAASEPTEGAYVAEKKSRFGWTRRSKGSARRKSTGKHDLDMAGLQSPYNGSQSVGVSKTSIAPDQHARIQAAAALLQQKQRQQETEQISARRGRDFDAASQKTNSVLTLQPVIMSEASPAMKWASKYDKDAIREAYLANNATGKGLGQPLPYSNGNSYHTDEAVSKVSLLQRNAPSPERDLPKVPVDTGAEIRPAVPAKTFTPDTVSQGPVLTVPESPVQKHLSEKAAEVAAPLDPHPVERKQEANMEQTRDVLTPEPLPDNSEGAPSPNTKKQHKLQKKNFDSEPRGFKKMFGRKNRQSKLPENAAAVLNGTQGQPQSDSHLQAGGTTLGRRFSGFRTKSPSASPHEGGTPIIPTATETPAGKYPTPAQSPETAPVMSYEPSLREDSSRIDTAEAHEAHQAFSTFDQGPLDDMPAFIPASPSTTHSEPEDSTPQPSISKTKTTIAPTPTAVTAQVPVQAPTPIRAPVRVPVPVPVAEHSTIITSAPTQASTPEKISTQAPVPVAEQPKESVPVQDRWAQIRKNAAERAAQRQTEEQSTPIQKAESAATEEGETSGEETIESRVARIKARVAELTGNMEGNGSPATQPARSPARW